MFDCDAVYHELLRTSAALRGEIAAAFGDVFAPDGDLDRKKLGTIVFGNADRLARLDAAVFKYLPRELARRMDGCGRELIALDAIKLTESGLAALCDLTVAVTAPEESRMRRIMLRDGISEEYARARIAAQRGEREFRTACGAVFENAYPTAEEAGAAADEFLNAVIEKIKEERSHG